MGVDDKVININFLFDVKVGIIVKDNVDGDIIKLLLIKGMVNIKIKGVYILIYFVKDKVGNIVMVIWRIMVKDNVKLVILGVENKIILLNSKFDSKVGVIVKDNVDGDMIKFLKIEGIVNIKVKGVYIFMYLVKDKSGNFIFVIWKIIVVDIVKFVIFGVINKFIKFNSFFNVCIGVIVKDNVDGDIIKSMMVSGMINIKKKGMYNFIYILVDKLGNKIIFVWKIMVN